MSWFLYRGTYDLQNPNPIGLSSLYLIAFAEVDDFNILGNQVNWSLR